MAVTIAKSCFAPVCNSAILLRASPSAPLSASLAISVVKPNGTFPLVNRELSWLYFNARVLQEAENPAVPLYERLGFLSIFSSNLDEFFSVRVAALRSLLRLGKPGKGLDEDPRQVLTAIQQQVNALQQRFGAVLRESVLPALAGVGRPLVRETELTDAERTALRGLFEANILPHLQPVVLDAEPVPHLAHQHLYLACDLHATGSAPDAPSLIGLVALPTHEAGRFVAFDAPAGTRVLFLDDVVRAFLANLFPGFTPGAAYSFKVSRDADLYLGDCHDESLKEEFAKQFRKRLRKSLEKRGAGLPTRFLYDPEMPASLLEALRHRFDLADEDLMPGGRYHHLRDLRDYPRPENHASLTYPPQPPVPHPALADAESLFDAIAAQDRLLSLPYQSFDPVVRWVEEAADDSRVERIAVTIYRAAEGSAIAAALERAALSGKRVEVVVELKARFDEANNLDVAERLEKAGARVFYTPCELKVHAKLVLVERRENGSGTPLRYAYLSTGNLNETTARFYTDFGLLTADPRLTDDVARVFEQMTDGAARPDYAHLLVAPHTLRPSLYRLIDAEAERARRGEKAWLFFKMNALEDPKMIRHLYQASEAGVEIRLLVRGICRLIPGLPGVSATVEARSIVGRYLEHGRAYVFGNGGTPAVYLGSADLMRRNLSRRVEVLFPLYADHTAREVLDSLEIQWADTLKARHLDAEGTNLFVRPEAGQQPFSSQDALYARYAGVETGLPLAPAAFPAAVSDPPPVIAAPMPDKPVASPAAQPVPPSIPAQTPLRPSPLTRVLRWTEARPFWSSMILLALLSLVPVLLMCNSSDRTIMPARRVAALDTSRASYLPQHPDTVLTLPAELAEISGQELLGDTLLVAIQDERGTLFLLDPQRGTIVGQHVFDDTGDFEEVAQTPAGLVVLRSDGELFFIADWTVPAAPAVRVETPLKRKCDAEGATYDGRANQLLISCKENPGKGYDGVRTIYGFDLDTQMLSAEPVFQIDLARVAAFLRHGETDDLTGTLTEALRLNDFKPSALGLHPLNGQLYVVASVPPAIAVLSPDGTLLGAELLPEGILPQPEGITFFSNGDMLISSEAAQSGAARLARYRYLKR